MNIIEAVILNPGGNVTAIVTTPVPDQARVELANRLLSMAEFKTAGVEQIGYMCRSKDNPSLFRIEMAGGELCLNASRCMAAYLSDIQSPKNNKEIKFEISGYRNNDGTPLPIVALVEQRGKNKFEVNLEFRYRSIILDRPRYRNIKLFGKNTNIIIVRLSGITVLIINFSDMPRLIKRLITPENAGKNNQELPELTTIFSRLYSALPFLHKEKAVGLIALQEDRDNSYRIFPMVKVNEQDTIYFESACGSGTLAVAAYNELATGELSMYEVIQPTGCIFRAGRITSMPESVFFQGPVEIKGKRIVNNP